MKTFHLILIMLTANMVLAQKNIVGFVTYKNNSPIKNVMVSIKNSDLKTFTDSKGLYSIRVPEDKTTLIFSKENLEVQEVEITEDVVNLAMTFLTDVDMFELSVEELMNIVITTPAKRDQKVSDVPASVVVITRSDIEAYGYQSLEEILSNALGMYKIDDYKNASFGVRGFFSNVYSRNIIFMINGVTQQIPGANWNDFTAMNLQVESIDRIEFVRGPVAIIYGNDAFFGAINIFTHQKGKNTPSSVTTSYGSENTYRANLQVNSDTDNMNVNLSAGYYNTDGRNVPFNKILDSVQRYDGTWIKNGTTKDFFKQESKYLNLSLEQKEFYANISYDETSRNLIHFWKPVYDTLKNTQKAFMLRGKIGYRKEINSIFKFDVHVGIQNLFSTNGYYKALVTPNTKYGFTKAASRKINFDLITFINPTAKMNITLGINYTTIPSGNLDLDIPALGYDRNTLEITKPSVLYAVYSQVEYKFSKKIQLLAGIRADKQNKYDYKNIRFTSNTYEDTVYSYNYDKIILVPRATIIYAFNPKKIIKLMYSKAISRPSIYENSYINWETHPLLVPQTIATTELNYAASLSNNLTCSASLFHNKLEQLINRSLITDAATGNYINVNNNTWNMETIGGEFQLIYKPMDNLMFDASLSYQKTTDKRFEIDAAYSPNVLAYFKTIYNIKKDIIFGLNSYYVGKMESEWDETPIDPQNGNLNPKGRIYKTTPGYFNLSTNLRFNNIFKSGFYFNLHTENILNTNIYYPPTTINSSYLPKGTIDSGIQVNAMLGFIF
jgi:outer membrane cobalamin receptor